MIFAFESDQPNVKGTAEFVFPAYTLVVNAAVTSLLKETKG